MLQLIAIGDACYLNVTVDEAVSRYVDATGTPMAVARGMARVLTVLPDFPFDVVYSEFIPGRR